MSQPDIVFFDGGCGLCHRAVRHALRHDRGRDQFRFAPLVGPTADEVLDEAFRRDPPDSLVVVTPEGEHLLRSSAVIRILKRLGGRHRVWGRLLQVVPRPLRDLGYRAVAAIRRKVFAAPDAACPFVPPDQRRYFPDLHASLANPKEEGS